MVLHHVPQGPGLLIVAAAAAHAVAFGHGDLDALHQVAVPQGLEDVVGEAEDQEVLDRLLAQVVVDPVNLGFFEMAVQQLIEILGRLRVAAEGLFHHQTGPAGAVVQLRLAQAGDGRSAGLRGQGQVKDAVSREMVSLFQGLEPGRQGPVIFRGALPQGLEREAGIAPGVGLPRLGQPGLGQGLPGQGPEARIGQAALTRDAHQ